MKSKSQCKLSAGLRRPPPAHINSPSQTKDRKWKRPSRIIFFLKSSLARCQNPATIKMTRPILSSPWKTRLSQYLYHQKQSPLIQYFKIPNSVTPLPILPWKRKIKIERLNQRWLVNKQRKNRRRRPLPRRRRPPRSRSQEIVVGVGVLDVFGMCIMRTLRNMTSFINLILQKLSPPLVVWWWIVFFQICISDLIN